MEAAEPGGERGAVGPEPSEPSQDPGAGGPEPPEAPDPVSERVCRGAARALAVPAERCAGAARALRGKAVFFLRPPGAGPGPAELLCGDLPADPLAHFAALLEEVIVPILTNRKNHQGWPRVVSQDIIHHVHSLKKTVFMVVGQVKGKTLLPLPAGSEGIENIDPENERFLELVDKSLVHATESAIIDWSHQIQRALKKESSEPLLQGSNPNPKVELEFWKNRCEELECIYDQLRSRKVRNMMEVLERVKSIYVPAFKSMLRDVEAALAEAQDIHLHLTPLQRPLEDIEAVEFSKVKPFLAPLLHMVCWIWATCKHYNVAVRIIVLLQEICNLLIQQAVVYLSPEDLLKGEMEESLGKVQTVLDILNGFKGVFEERRENLHMYYEPGQEVRKWDFHSRMVFARLDSFLKRLEMVKGLLTTALDLTKLEKMEFSGIRGRALGQQVLDMHEEFQEAYRVFAERSYDCLDLASTEFEQDALGFQQKVEDIDHRLSTVFTQAFDDTLDLEHVFKLLTMFQSLLERPVIAAVAADKWPVLISMFSTALDHTRLIYCSHTQAGLKLGSPPLHKNMPSVAGALAWARELRARIQRPFDQLRHIPHLCLDSAQGRRVVQKYEEMIQLLDRYQDKLYLDWSQTVSEKSQYNLTQPLIRRDPETKLITVNFDPQENQSLLLADPASDSWKAYVDYVDEIVLDGFFTAIECSLKYLLENTGC
ncbi:dynein axonemal heavy chain 9-like [Myiozetetes cayanensis]|uniref:dynein axonemal heavy chain 9-like n=1 Tax=Myiozetetes cayanensis TaxID=478635 RepID=UPI002160F145|nr:dynein axonemal heavy chain 9-like [Myiozetetes cayanensis]